MSGFLSIWHINSDGKARRITEDALPTAAEKSGYVWIHMDAMDPFTRQWMIDDPDIDAHATENLLSGDSRPRTIAHQNVLLLNLRGVNLNEGSEPTDMVGIRFILSEKRVISVQRRQLRATQDIEEQFSSQIAPVSTGSFTGLFAEILSDRMGPTLTDMSEKVDVLEDEMDNHSHNVDRSHLSTIRRDALALKRYLAPQRDALNTLAIQTMPWITERDRLYIRHSADQATRITEELEAIRERCAVLRDYLADHRAEMMNTNMMVLSVVAAIFLPLGLISGMMGINVGGMPWTENPNGFWFVTAIVVATGALLMAIFKWLKWL